MLLQTKAACADSVSAHPLLSTKSIWLVCLPLTVFPFSFLPFGYRKTKGFFKGWCSARIAGSLQHGWQQLG